MKWQPKYTGVLVMYFSMLGIMALVTRGDWNAVAGFSMFMVLCGTAYWGYCRWIDGVFEK